MIAVLINIVLILIGGSIGLFFKGNKKVERYVTRITAILSVMILAFGIQSIEWRQSLESCLRICSVL